MMSWHPDRLRRQVEYMDAHPEVDVLGTGAYSIDSDYRLQGIRSRTSIPSSDFGVGMRGLFLQPTVMGRTAWFLANPYDETASARRCEDAELWFRTFGRTTYGLLEEPLLFYREDSADAIKKLRSSNSGRIRFMFRGQSEVRRKSLCLRLAWPP